HALEAEEVIVTFHCYSSMKKVFRPAPGRRCGAGIAALPCRWRGRRSPAACSYSDARSDQTGDPITVRSRGRRCRQTPLRPA
ncbi:hypothetical protein Tco_0549691, partial [Tanacetum coccineum]